MKRLFLILTSVIFGTSIFAQDQFTTVKQGDQVPAFSFEESPWVTRSISDYKGKVVLITFFATWCGPCRQELPFIEREIYRKYSGSNDFTLMIFGREHDWETVNRFKVQQQFSMPFYPDRERKIFSKFASQNIPRNFLLDKNGRIIASTVGFTEKEFGKLKSEIENAIHESK